MGTSPLVTVLVTTGTRTGSGAAAAGADVLVGYKRAPSRGPAAARPKRETKINRLLMLCSISGRLAAERCSRGSRRTRHAIGHGRAGGDTTRARNNRRRKHWADPGVVEFGG